MLLALSALAATSLAQAQSVKLWEFANPHQADARIDAQAIAPASGLDWYTVGHVYADDPATPAVDYVPAQPVVQRVDQNGTVEWSHTVPVAAGAAQGPVAVASLDSLVTIAYSSNGVKIQRVFSSGLGSSGSGPANSKHVIPDSMFAPAGTYVLATTYTNGGFGYLVFGGTGVLQQTHVVPGAPAGATFAGANSPQRSRFAASATALAQPGAVFVASWNGTLLWMRADVDFLVRSIALGPNGELAAAGVDTAGFARFRLYDETGAVVGDHTLLDTPDSEWNDVDFDVWGGAFAAGRAGRDAAIAAFTPAGGFHWVRTWTGAGDLQEEFRLVRVSLSGEPVATGSSDLNAPLPFDAHLEELLVTGWKRDGALAFAHRDPTIGTQVERWNALEESVLGAVVGVGVRAARVSSSASFEPVGAHAMSLRAQAVSLCFGDETSIVPCPCGNVSPPGQQRGCYNTTLQGARLVEGGQASLANDTLTLTVSDMPPTTSCLLFESTSLSTQAFGDGLRCAISPTVRLFTEQAQGGVTVFPPPGGPSLSARSAAAGGPLQPGSLRIVQAYYRNSAPFCVQAAGFNTSPAMIVTWRQ